MLSYEGVSEIEWFEVNRKLRGEPQPKGTRSADVASVAGRTASARPEQFVCDVQFVDLAIGPDSKTLYVLLYSETGPSIFAYDTTSLQLIGTSAQYTASFVSATADGTKLILQGYSGEDSVIFVELDAKTLKKLNEGLLSIPLPGVVSADGSTIYALVPGQNEGPVQLAIVDTTTLTVTKTYPIVEVAGTNNGAFGEVALSPDGSEVYVTFDFTYPYASSGD